MALIPEFGLAPGEDEEGLFSRDIEGQLVRLDAATEKDYKTLVELRVNGRPVQVALAEPLKDSQGNILQDIHGRTVPRYTTILDAIVKINAGLPASRQNEKLFVPTLCHQPHMTPVAVCRVCMVQVCSERGKKKELIPERKLQPACHHYVKDGMVVFTGEADDGTYGPRVKRAVDVIAELLISDHLRHLNPAAAHTDKFAEFNELRQLAVRLELSPSRFTKNVLAKAKLARSVVDSSSPVFLVDRGACILCDRCIRACDEVVKNDVIGRTGKGPKAQIGFDLNDRMFDSSCVQCGECMVSCPTDAITFKPLKEISAEKGADLESIPTSELMLDPLFAGVPAKFLLWQEALVLRRPLRDKDVLCRQGEPGHSAFVIKRGRLKISQRRVEPVFRTVEDVIVGEMACLSGTPRNADISADGDGEVWEVRRNVLDRMMRSPDSRQTFEKIYRKRALATTLSTTEFFAGLPPDENRHIAELIAPTLRFVRVSPRQTIFEQGDFGDLVDCLYLIRLGHVRVGISRDGHEATVLYRGPNTVVGEIGLLGLSRSDAGKTAEQIDREICAALACGTPLPAGERTATCSALDHVELARIDRNDFLSAIRQCPTLRMKLIRVALVRLKEI